MPVLDLILSRLPATLELTLAAVLGATLLGVPLGMYAGYKPDGIASKLIMGLSILGFSVPTFWVGLVLIFTFAVTLGWLPAGGRGDTVTVFGVRMELPHARRTAPPVPARAEPRAVQARHDDPPRARRHARGDADRHGEVRARGRRDAKRTILSRHVLRLISIPLVTVFGLEFSSTLAFAVVTETIFSWPGIGKLIIDSISSLDRPVMVAYLMLVAFLFIMINFLVDIAYAALDPRLRVRRA